jgi:hypothetical protein
MVAIADGLDVNASVSVPCHANVYFRFPCPIQKTLEFLALIVNRRIESC